MKNLFKKVTTTTTTTTTEELDQSAFRTAFLDELYQANTYEDGRGVASKYRGILSDAGFNLGSYEVEVLGLGNFISTRLNSHNFETY